jgi:hypothetical protein
MEKELIAFEDVRQLAQKMHNAGLRELEWRGADWSVRLRYPSGKTMAEPPPLPPLAAETRPLSVCSPMPGRLLLSHPSHGEAFVSEGSTLRRTISSRWCRSGRSICRCAARWPGRSKPYGTGGEPAGVRQRDRAAAAHGCRFREVIRTPYRAKLFMSYPRWT